MDEALRRSVRHGYITVKAFMGFSHLKRQVGKGISRQPLRRRPPTSAPLSREPHAALCIAAGCSHRIKTGWQRPLPSISPTAAIIGSGRCQSCPRPLPTEKAWPFSRLGMRASQFAHASLPIALRLSISHTNVSHSCSAFLQNDYPARSDLGSGGGTSC